MAPKIYMAPKIKGRLKEAEKAEKAEKAISERRQGNQIRKHFLMTYKKIKQAAEAEQAEKAAAWMAVAQKAVDKGAAEIAAEEAAVDAQTQTLEWEFMLQAADAKSEEAWKRFEAQVHEAEEFHRRYPGIPVYIIMRAQESLNRSKEARLMRAQD